MILATKTALWHGRVCSKANKETLLHFQFLLQATSSFQQSPDSVHLKIHLPATVYACNNLPPPLIPFTSRSKVRCSARGIHGSHSTQLASGPLLFRCALFCAMHFYPVPFNDIICLLCEKRATEMLHLAELRGRCRWKLVFLHNLHT